MTPLNIGQTAQMLMQMDDVLILCHKYPDGDTIGSAFALCTALLRIGKRAAVMCSDIIPSKYSYIYEHIEIPEFEPRHIVAVDVADTKLLGSPLEETYGDKIELCIDHHASNIGYAQYLLLDSKAAACGEILCHLIPMLGVEIDKHIANGLFTALSTDSGCFRYPNTTPETMRIAASLMEAGADAAMINRLMFETKSRARMEVERGVLSTLEFWFDSKCAVIVLENALVERLRAGEGDLEGLAPIPKRIEGVKVGVLLRECEDGWKISVRSDPDVSASDICKQLGGGGHFTAAGCHVDGSLEEAKFIIKNVIERYI